MEVTRPKFEQLCADVLSKTQTIVDIVMDDADMKPADLYKVLLVGGSSPAGKAYKNICQRINGEEVPFMDLDARKGMLGVIKGLFGMN